MISLKEKWNQGMTWREYFILSVVMTIVGVVYGLFYWALTMNYSWVENLKRRFRKPNPGRYDW